MAKHNRECSIGDNNRHGTFSIFLLQGNYDNNYKVTGITDPKGYLYERSCDKDDRLTGTENPLSETEKYTYDAVGNCLSYVKKTRTTKHSNKADVAESAFYRYNDNNQLVSAK